MQNKKVIIIAVAALAVLLASAAALAAVFAPKGSEGEKTIVFEVVYADDTSDSFTITTDEEFLIGALEQEGLAEYVEDGYYTTINGVTADWARDQSWWNLTKDGEALMVGFNDQPIADGEHYEAIYTIG